MIGRHVIRTWSSTQPSVTLSSGEAEYYGLVKAAGAGLGHQSIMKDFGLQVPVRVWTDSSAALGISSRSGLGKLRHLETHTLWVQGKVRTGAIQVRKLRGEVNPADLFTKFLPSSVKIDQLVKLFGCEYREGRSSAAPMLRPQETTGDQGGQSPSGHLPTFEVREGELHDIEILPHMYDEHEGRKLFPLLEAPLPMDNEEDWQPTGDHRGCDDDQGAMTCATIQEGPGEVRLSSAPTLRSRTAGSRGSDQRRWPRTARPPGSLQPE